MMQFVYSWKRRWGSVASKPLSQPSPVSGSTHRVEPVKDSVPLSCVPVTAVSSGEYGLTEMLYVCSVPGPALITSSSVGIRLSHAWQSVRFCPVSRIGRVLHWLDASAYFPLVRITPPSEPTKN